MDAFAVAVCKGLEMKKFTVKGAFIVASFFGGFQGIMPLIGYFVGTGFSRYTEKIGYLISFTVLFYLGSKMILESNKANNIKNKVYILNIKELFFLGIATSIDALAVGMTFAYFKTNIFLSILLIGSITFLIAFFGVFLGSRFGEKYNSLAKRIGGFMLVLIGCKILLEHLIMLWREK